MKKTTVVNIRTDEYDVYIGRPSKWGNPFKIGVDGTRSQVINKYKEHVLSDEDLTNSLHELQGKRLGCWCKPKSCHGDALAELADEQLLKQNRLF